MLKDLKMHRKILLAFLTIVVSAGAMRLQHEAGYVWSTVKENPGGKCTSTTECDGVRTCVSGKCQGEARPPKDIFYFYSETQTEGGCPNYAKDPKMANKDYYCDGLRTCVNGKCQGYARPIKRFAYTFDEKKTGGKCPYVKELKPANYFGFTRDDYFCDGFRVCQSNGQCAGIARV